MTRVLLADDEKLVREGWCLLLDHASDISIVGQARDGQEAVELAVQLRPGVILMDVRMPRLDGLAATRQIVQQQGDTKILMVTQSADEALIRTALQQGASGYLSKTDMFHELLPAIQALQAGQLYFGKTIRAQYSHVVDEPRSRIPLGRHTWQDSAWASLEERLERAKAEARAIIDRDLAIRQRSRALRAQSQKTRALTHQLLRLRHSDAPPATL